MRPAQELVPHGKSKSAVVHVEDHREDIRHMPLVLVRDSARVEGAGGQLVVVERLETAEVPAPAGGGVSQQTLIAP